MCSERRRPRVLALVLGGALAAVGAAPAHAERPYYLTFGLEAGVLRLQGDHGTYGANGLGKMLVLGLGYHAVSVEWHVGQTYTAERPEHFVGKGLDGEIDLASYVVRYRPARWLALTAGVAHTSLAVVEAAAVEEERVSAIGGVAGVGVGFMRRGGFFSLELRGARGLSELPARAYLVPDGAGGYRPSTDDLSPWFVTVTLAVRSHI